MTWRRYGVQLGRLILAELGVVRVAPGPAGLVVPLTKKKFQIAHGQ
jgi:hypothetical protein